MLGAVDDLNWSEQRKFRKAKRALRIGARTHKAYKRRKWLRRAARQLRKGIEGLSTGLQYELGPGSLMF